MDQGLLRATRIREGGMRILPLFEYIGLIVALLATLTAGVQEIAAMWHKGRVEVTDLLVLFIYLEVLSMIESYWKAGKLPVRMPLYITMVSLARHLMLENQTLGWADTLGVAISIVLLAVAVLVVRYGHIRFPYSDSETPHGDH